MKSFVVNAFQRVEAVADTVENVTDTIENIHTLAYCLKQFSTIPSPIRVFFTHTGVSTALLISTAPLLKPFAFGNIFLAGGFSAVTFDVVNQYEIRSPWKEVMCVAIGPVTSFILYQMITPCFQSTQPRDCYIESVFTALFAGTLSGWVIGGTSYLTHKALSFTLNGMERVYDTGQAAVNRINQVLENKTVTHPESKEEAKPLSNEVAKPLHLVSTSLFRRIITRMTGSSMPEQKEVTKGPVAIDPPRKTDSARHSNRCAFFSRIICWHKANARKENKVLSQMSGIGRI